MWKVVKHILYSAVQFINTTVLEPTFLRSMFFHSTTVNRHTVIFVHNLLHPNGQHAYMGLLTYTRMWANWEKIWKRATDLIAWSFCLFHQAGQCPPHVYSDRFPCLPLNLWLGSISQRVYDVTSSAASRHEVIRGTYVDELSIVAITCASWRSSLGTFVANGSCTGHSFSRRCTCRRF